MFSLLNRAFLILLFNLATSILGVANSGEEISVEDKEPEAFNPEVYSGPVVCSRPAYPVDKRGEPLEGEVTVLISVDNGGEPISVEVLTSSGNETLDQAALANAMMGSYPHAAGQTISVDFSYEITDL